MKDRGFTLIELLIALTLGMVVMGGALSVAVQQLRHLDGSDVRDDLARNARYMSSFLRHDLNLAGVELRSTTSFGTLDVWDGSGMDTLVVLYTPYDPSARIFDLDPPIGSPNPLPPGGTCGTNCIHVRSDTVDLAVGDLVRIQTLSARRVGIVENVVTTSDTTAEITFTAATQVLRHQAGVEGVVLDGASTFVRPLGLVAYYIDANSQLVRSDGLELSGAFKPDIVAENITTFDVSLIFADGDEYEVVTISDTDDTNDYDDVVTARIRSTVTAARADPRVNQGQLLTRDLALLLTPRNLRFQRNKI